MSPPCMPCEDANSEYMNIKHSFSFSASDVIDFMKHLIQLWGQTDLIYDSAPFARILCNFV